MSRLGECGLLFQSEGPLSLDERLAVPRRAEPRVRVEAGSVVIGGGQTGVISRTSPSGWHIIGRTETELFDVRRAQAALLSPGDRVRFTSVTVGK